MTKVGHDGVVSVEESSTMSTELEFTEGVGFDKGFLSAYFVTDFDSQEAVLDDPLILLHQDKISSLPDLLPLLEKVAESGKPLVIIAEDVEGEAAGDPGRQLHPQDAQGGRGQVAVLRRPAQGVPRGPGGRHRRSGGQPRRRPGAARGRSGRAGLGPARRGQQGRHHHRRRRRLRRTRSPTASSSCAPRSRPATPNGIARSCRSGWPSWPAGWPSSRWAPPPRPRSRSARKASRMPSRPPRPPSRRASSPAAGPR